MLKDFDERTSRRKMIAFFETLTDEEQEEIMDSPRSRLPDEDADTFVKRVTLKRVVHQTIDRYQRATQ